MLKNIFRWALVTFCVAFSASATASININMTLTNIDGTGISVGTIVIDETPYGLLFTPHLHALIPGAHGFHIHQHPTCEKDGMEAGGHYDPKHTGKHLGPYNEHGHLGDLPILFVNADGTATLPVLAPRLHSLQEIQHRALIIHDGGDNYADVPQKLGGGGGRMLCGVIDW
ncbi:MAG TPA: superoxide dismutase [Cu-Zn] SodC [Gammaproteobacteria bacterium]|nr:superoxide dismutase [Cu-Zn] SodC [Gammaproteobacteria bacterium]